MGSTGMAVLFHLAQPSIQANLQREIQHDPTSHHSVDCIFAQWRGGSTSIQVQSGTANPLGVRGRLRGGRRGARNRTGFIQIGGWAMMSLVLGGSTVRKAFPRLEWTRACNLAMHQLAFGSVCQGAKVGGCWTVLHAGAYFNGEVKGIR